MDTRLMLAKESIRSLLKQDIRMVTFTKVDGKERVMKCTLKEEYLPTQDVGKLLVDKSNNLEGVALSVWDLDRNGWRSFRTASVKNVADVTGVVLISIPEEKPEEDRPSAIFPAPDGRKMFFGNDLSPSEYDRLLEKQMDLDKYYTYYKEANLYLYNRK